MSTRPTSADVLQALWARYRTQYRSVKGRDPSKSQFCKDLGWDRSALSKWMKPDTPNHRRIPLERIGPLSTALMLSLREEDKLMAARVRELLATDASLRAALAWVAVKAREAQARRGHLDVDEKRVLTAYREAALTYPRGLYGDREEAGLLLAQMQVTLERAEGLHAQEAQTEQDAETPDLTARKQAVLAKIAAHQAVKRQPAFREAKRRARGDSPR